MDEKPQYNLIYLTDSWLQRTIGSMLFYGFLAFLVWLGNGSVWWTFLFGTIAFLGIVGRMKYYWDNYHRWFTSKADLLEFVQKLP